MSKAPACLGVAKATVAYHNKCVLDNVSCEIESGELLAIIGPNGAGKSTLLHALSDRSPASKATLNQQPLSSFSSVESAQKIAVLTQQHQLPFAFTVKELVSMGRYPFSTGQELDQRLVEQALLATDVLSMQYSDYTELSGGEQQRAQLARVLAQAWPCSSSNDDEHFLLLDEPTTGLDLQHQSTIFDCLKQLTQAGVGVVVVTHDINLAGQYADRMIVMNHGVIHAQGTPQELINADIMVPVFGKRLAFIESGDSADFIIPLRGE